MAFLPIPEFERYLIGTSGVVLDNEAEQVLISKQEISLNSKVKLLYPNRTDRYKTVSVARLILLTHKPIENVNIHSVWSPKIIGNDSRNICVSNLDYDFGEYIPYIPNDSLEFCPIPGYVDSFINLNGDVMMNGKIGKLGKQRNYTVASVKLPEGYSVTVGRHRLMALTFLRRPVNCNDLLVNHKNGKPSDDRLENLEWVSYRGNMEHAHLTGLNTNNIPIETKNLMTGEIQEFFSIGAFSRIYQLNSRDTKRLEFRMRNFRVVANFRGFAIRRKNEAIPWDQLNHIDQYKGNAKEVIVKNTITNETHEFIWFHEAADFLNVTQYVLRNRLQKFGTFNFGIFSVSYSVPFVLTGNIKTETKV